MQACSVSQTHTAVLATLQLTVPVPLKFGVLLHYKAASPQPKAGGGGGEGGGGSPPAAVGYVPSNHKWWVFVMVWW